MTGFQEADNRRLLTSSLSQSGSEGASTTLNDNDNRMSIRSAGSRQAAFSKDLADPDFLANMAIIARDVPLREHMRGSLVYPDSFTGRDLISTLQRFIPAEPFTDTQEAISYLQQRHNARLAALQVAEALREQSVFHDLEWDQGVVVDSDDVLYTFNDDMLAGPRRFSSFQGAPKQTADPESMEGSSQSDAQPVAGLSIDPSTRTHRGPQRSKTLPWSDLVNPELRSKLDTWEVQRQNAIAETIQREEQFLADLELLQELFVEGLRIKSIIAADEHDDFVKVVFGNHRQLATHIRALVEELHVRQAERYPLVRRIGDLFLNAALGWREEYCSAITNYPFAANRVQKEEAKNPAFRVFLEECMRDPRAQRYPLTNFLYRPVVRLQRYHLHFKSIMEVIKRSEKATETRRPPDAEAMQEYETLATVSGIIHTQVRDAQQGLGISKDKVDIANLAEGLAATAKRPEFEVDMDLRNPERRLKHQGQVLLDGVKMQAILFDNYFVLVKEPKVINEQPCSPQRLVLAKRPIPVELLEMSGFNARSTSTSLALKFMHLSSSTRTVYRTVWPFTVSHRLGRTEAYTLTVGQESARREWQRKLEEACAMRKIVQDAVKAWTMSTLNDDVFAVTNVEASDAEVSRDPLLKGRVSAAAPFQILLENQQRPCIAFGTERGVFVGPRRTSAIQRVLDLRNVTQLAVMEELDLLFVLANGVLWVCRLVDLFVPPAHPTGQHSSPILQQVSSKEEEILFFNIGMLDNQRVVVFARKKPYDRGTAFTTLEVHYDSDWSMRAHFGSRHQGVQLKPFRNGRFEVGFDVFSLKFRRKGLCLCTAKGFELCNLGRNEPPAFLSVPTPPKKEDVTGQALQKRIQAAKPMALFKIAENEFLLCFDTFGCFVHADRTVARDGAVLEWETEPTSFVFRSPYLLAIDSRFVEIRTFNSTMRTATGGANAQSGRLLQLLRGQHMRLVNTQCNDSVDLMPAYGESRRDMDGQSGAEKRHSDQDAIVLCQLKEPQLGAQSRLFQAIAEVVPFHYDGTPRVERVAALSKQREDQRTSHVLPSNITKQEYLNSASASMDFFRTAILLARTSLESPKSPKRLSSKLFTASRFSMFRRKAVESGKSSEPRSVAADKGHLPETAGTSSKAFLDHPFVRTVADLFNENINETGIRTKFERIHTTCTEEDYMNDLKQCVSAIHFGQPWPGRRADFPSSSSSSASDTGFPASFPLDPQEADRLGDEEYAKWSAKELAELSSMMADMCERNPALFKVSKEPEERYASSVSPSVFTFIPPDPRAYYRHLLSRMLTHDLEAMKRLGPDEQVSVGILSQENLVLLDAVARCWRVTDGWRCAVRFDLVLELYEDGQCPLDSVEDALRMFLEPAYTTPPGSTRAQTMTKGWMIYERDLLSISLNQSFRSVLRWLYNELQDPFGVDVEQVTLHLTFVQNIHSTGLLFEPPDPNLTGSSPEEMPLGFIAVNLDKHIEELKDAVQIGAINMYAEHTAELFGKVLPPGSNEVKPLLELCDWVTSRAKILEKQWNSHARVFDIDVVALVLRKQVPLFLDDLESMKQSVLDRTNALPLNDPKSTHFDQIFGLLRTVRGLFQLYATFCPEQIVQGAEDAHLLAQEELPEGEQDESWPSDQLTGRLQKDAALLAKVGRLGTFSLSRWFEPHVWRWLSDTELQLEPFAAHSPSIDILFSELQAPVDFVLGLDWSDKLANARFTGKLAEFVSRAVEQYFTKSEGRFRREMGSASDRVAQTIKTGLEPALFHIRPMSCVRLNNIEKARKQLDKLYSKIDADEQARIVNRHGPSPEFSETPGQEVTQQGGTLSTSSQRFLFTVKIVLGEELSSVSFSAGSAGSSSSVSGLNSFVTLSQETGRTLAITRKIHNSAEKRWNETFDFSVQGNLVLNLTLWNNDLEAGKAVLRLNPSSGLRSSSEESWLTLDTGARLLVQVSMEEEKDDVVFAFGRANRSLKRAESTMVGILVDEISSYARLYLSPEGLESLATSLQSSSVTSVGIGAESSRPATDRQIRAKLSPLLNYLKGCLATLTLGLSDTVATLVLQQVWEEILKIIEDILVPPLGITLSTFEPLDDLEVYIVFKWLQLLLTCFNGKGKDTDEKARVPLHILQGPKYREIMSYSLCNDMSTNQLLTEIQRLVQQRDRAQGVHYLDPAVHGARLTPSVYDQRNLGAIEQWERKKAKEVEAKGNLELLLRLLRMRPDAEHYLQMTYDAARVAYVRPPNEKLYQRSSSTTAGPFEETTVYDAGQHLRAPTQIPISARSQPVDHTRMFDTVREQEKAYAGEDNVKVHRALYEGPSTTFETMSERPRPWRAETQESCGTSHEAEAAIMNGRLGCLLLSFPASAAFLLLVATFSRSASSWQGTHDPPRLGLVALLLMVSLRSTFLVRLPLVHIVRVMTGSNSPAAKHLGGLIHHGRQVLLVADIVIVGVLALCHIDGTSWYHAAVRYVGLQRVNEEYNELGTPHTQPSLDQKFTPPARPREDTPEAKPTRKATKGQRPSSLRIFVLFLVCQAAVIFLYLVAYFEGHLAQLGPVQGRAAPSWQHFAFLLLLLAVSMDVSLFSHRQLTLSPVLTAIFGSRPFVAPLQDLLEHVRLASLQVDLVAVLGLAFLFCTGGSWYEAAANHIGLETRTVVAAGATSSSPHVKANAPLSDSVPLAPTVADDGPTDGIERGSGFDEEAEVQGYLIEDDASEHSHKTPADTTPATKSINVDGGIPRDHDRKGKSRQVNSAADQFASLMSKLKADNLATTEALNAALLRDSKASARAPGSRPSEQGQSSRIQDDQEPSI